MEKKFNRVKEWFLRRRSTGEMVETRNGLRTKLASRSVLCSDTDRAFYRRDLAAKNDDDFNDIAVIRRTISRRKLVGGQSFAIRHAEKGYAIFDEKGDLTGYTQIPGRATRLYDHTSVDVVKSSFAVSDEEFLKFKTVVIVQKAKAKKP